MLKIVDDAVLLVALVRPYVQDIARGDADLARQLRKSSKSVAQNLAEGSGCSGGRRRNHYRIALGSARETEVSLRLAIADGLVEAVDPTTLDLVDKIIRVGVRLSR